MTKFLLGTTALAALLSVNVAQAADMPLKAPPRAPVVISDWTGFYLGVHGGYGWGDVKLDVDLTPVFADPSPKGWVFGGHAGYLWQWGNVVGGLEIDYSAADLKDDQTVTFKKGGEVPVTVSITESAKIDALGSARARLGFLWTPNLLAYGTAGIGWAHSKLGFSADVCFRNECGGGGITAAESSFGWVAGGGLEYQFNNNWRLRAEYLHYDFGTVGYAFQPVLTLNADVSVDVVRGALSFKF